MNDVMLDLETLGAEPGCVILAIGALRFDRSAADLEGAKSFYRILKLSDPDGIHADASTLCWWMQQSDQARTAIFGVQAQTEAVGARAMLAGLAMFLSETEVKRLWSNGPMFDERIIRDALKMYGYPPPAHYRSSRCCRTVYDLAKTLWGGDCEKNMNLAVAARVPEAGRLPKHHALGDCFRQAAHVQAIYQAITRQT